MKKARASRPSPVRDPGEQYVLRLYVAGLTPRSRSAIANITNICEEYLGGRYDLEVIDVFKRPGKSLKASNAPEPATVL